jgi:hypothetical protein
MGIYSQIFPDKKLKKFSKLKYFEKYDDRKQEI